MIPYILYSALILSACLLFYKLLLQKETFFHLNRFVLLSCMILAFVVPLLPVPQQLSFRNESAAIPVAVVKSQVHESKNTLVNQPLVQETVTEQTTHLINVEVLLQCLVYLYWFGVALFGINFLMQAIILMFRSYSKSVIQDGKIRIVEITGDKAPCSFANNIFINPEKYEWETYNQILLHEKIHIEQKHTIDILLAEILLIFQWFNPFAWQWRKVLESNLEFLTDDQMLKQDTVEKESYQFSLLKVAAPQFPLSLTTNYNQSLLKKRIIMMNSKKSNVNTTWKYFFILPLMVLFACLFNQPTAQSQTISSKNKEKSKQEVHIHDGMNTEGNWFATIKGNTVNIQFKSDGNDTSSTNFELSEFKNLPRDKKDTFTLTRDAGTMQFTGKFEDDKGMGTYKFVADKNYSAAMIKEGINVTQDTELMTFFMVNVKLAYVKTLKQKGYDKVEKGLLIPLVALDVNEAYINSIKEAGIDIDLDNLIPFRSLGIDKAYIEEIRNAGFKDISPESIVALKSQGIDGKYIADFRSATNSKSSEESDDDIMAFKSMNIDKEFVNSFKELGYTNVSNSDIIAMKSLNITPKYLKSFQDAGFKDVKPESLIALKSQNVQVALIQQYKDAGITDLNLDDVIGAKSMNASPSFIKSMREKGHNFNSLEKYIELKAVLGK